jgi:hypothetical protein
MITTLRLKSDGPFAFTFVAGGLPVGSLRDGRLRVTGFTTPDEAAAAGEAGSAALARWIERRNAHTTSGLARLDHPSARVLADEPTGIAVEFSLPSDLPAAVAIGAASHIYAGMAPPPAEEAP